MYIYLDSNLLINFSCFLIREHTEIRESKDLQSSFPLGSSTFANWLATVKKKMKLNLMM